VCRQGSRRHRSKSHHRRPAHTNKVSESADQFDDSDGELTEVRSIYVNSVTAAQVGNFKRVNCFVDNVPLELIVDTGAKVSIISNTHYSKYLCDHKLSLSLVVGLFSKPVLSLRNLMVNALLVLAASQSLCILVISCYRHSPFMLQSLANQ